MNRIETLLSQMSVTEKALLCTGKKFWFTRGIKKYGIEPYMVSDGPHGLLNQSADADHLGVNASKKATCFPPACTMASSWDPALIEGIGKRIGEEAKEEQLGIVLGPGANIKRSPLCGRNFEYFSEDPYLTGKCAEAMINGIQSQGIGTSLKHFAANNQEDNRLRINAVVDERALREIYLSGFEHAVKAAKPWTLMCAYNRLNGEYASENKWLLNDVLREEWGFEGYVMTDWGAINDRVKALESGLDLEMPGDVADNTYAIIRAVEEGRLSTEVLDRTVRRLLEANFRAAENKKTEYKYDRHEHHAYARKAATEGAVLLKNEGALPLAESDPVIAIGALFRNPRYQGSGSSMINPHSVVSPEAALRAAGTHYVYAEGFSAVLDDPDEGAIAEAVELAKKTDGKIVVFAGLTMFYESEGFDRKHMRLPTNQNILIEKLIGLGKPVIVVLYGGSPVELPWADKVDGIINMYLPGEAVGEATYDLLFGKVNPSGKLAESYPYALEDNSSAKHFPEGPRKVEYRESIYVGYRYYDTAEVPVRYPFGYGLSYTEFEYSDLRIEKTEIEAGETLRVACTVKNIGSRAGKEIVQLYVGRISDGVFRAEKELKGFVKVDLMPGESKQAEFTLDRRSFAYYNVKLSDWAIEAGQYRISVGASSRDIRLGAEITIHAPEVPAPYDKDAVAEYYHPTTDISEASFVALYGKPMPEAQFDNSVFNYDTTVAELKSRFLGKMFGKLLCFGVKFAVKATDDASRVMQNFVREMLVSNPMRAIGVTAGGAMNLGMLDGMLMMFNGKFFKGLGVLLKSLRFKMKFEKQLAAIEDVQYVSK